MLFQGLQGGRELLLCHIQGGSWDLLILIGERDLQSDVLLAIGLLLNNYSRIRMKDIVIPSIKKFVTDKEYNSPQKLQFTGDDNTCGGHLQCSGRRILENTCNALLDTKGYRGMDPKCAMTMIKVQMDALNKLMGIPRTARERIGISLEDVEEILQVIRDENHLCIREGEPELNAQEVFNLITELLIEKLYVDKTMSSNFFGALVDVEQDTAFKDLDPRLLNKMKATMSDSAKLIFFTAPAP